MMFSFARLGVLLGILLCAFLPVASVRTVIAQEEAGPSPTVRFVHVYAGGGPIDIYIDDALAVSDLVFGTTTEYAAFPVGERHILVVAAGQPPETVLIDKRLEIAAGSAYNVLIGGLDSALDARLYEVNLDGLTAEQTRFRFIQASPDAGNLDIQLESPMGGEEEGNTGTPDIGSLPGAANVGLFDDQDYQTVRAGTYDIAMSETSSDQPLFEAPNIDLTAGNVYDFVVIGKVESQNLALLPLITPVGSLCGVVMGTPQTLPTAQAASPVPVCAAPATAVGGSQATSTPVLAASMTPVITPESTPIP